MLDFRSWLTSCKVGGFHGTKRKLITVPKWMGKLPCGCDAATDYEEKRRLNLFNDGRTVHIHCGNEVGSWKTDQEKDNKNDGDHATSALIKHHA